MCGAILCIALLGGSSRADDGAYVISVGKTPDPASTMNEHTAATLSDAFAIMRAQRAKGWTGGFDVQLAEGIYRPTETLDLQPEDSGSSNAPVVIRSRPGEIAVISGASFYHAQRFNGEAIGAGHVDLGAIAGNLAVLRLDAKLAAIAAAEAPRGSFFAPARGGLRIFQGEARLTPARWPKHEYAITTGVLAEGDAKAGPVFKIPQAKAVDWVGEKDLWIGAYWGHDWHWETNKAIGLDSSAATLSASPLRQVYPMRQDARYFVSNALSELGEPGGYYIDREKGLLAYRPAEGASDPLLVEAATLSTLLVLHGVHDVIFEGLAFEKTIGDTIVIQDSADILFKDCLISNSGSRGLVVRGGHGVVFDRSIIAHSGESGADLAGGDRTSLTPSAHRISNSIIAYFGEDVKAYRAAIMLDGVGQIVERSLLTHGPHYAIWFAGNDHLIQGNDIGRVATETLDVGAIMAGRDWTARGTRIFGNYFHDIEAFSRTRPYDAPSIYLDDFISQTSIEDNVFANVDQGVFIHSGRDNTVRNNLFSNVRLPAVRVESIKDSKYGDEVLAGGTALQRLKAAPYQSPLYARRYPHLPNILSDDLLSPKYNVISSNVFSKASPFQFDRGAALGETDIDNVDVAPVDWASNATIAAIAEKNTAIDWRQLMLGKIETSGFARDLFMHLKYAEHVLVKE
jgi:parallel beta-helix repeat protein